MYYICLTEGIGNQLFMYAYLRNLQINNNIKAKFIHMSKDKVEKCTLLNFNVADKIEIISLDEAKKEIPVRFFVLDLLEKTERRIFGNKSSFMHNFEKSIQGVLNFFGIGKVSFAYIPIKINEKRKKSIVHGYFQSFKYFEDNIDEIKKEINNNSVLSQDNQDIVKYIKSKRTVCVHVRCGDYFNDKNIRRYYVCTPEYYQSGMAYMLKNLQDCQFLVFSDDMNWTKNNIQFPDNTLFSDKTTSAIEDFQLMALCHDYIISNSTFSWWAQYLGATESSIVYAPEIWTNTNDPCDIYMSNWVTQI